MSADNWAICPKCSERFSQDIERKQEKVKRSYGQVSEAEYLRLKDEIEDFVKPEISLREDYEIGINNKEFYVMYNASCSKCGWSFKYRYEEMVRV